ncbi:MAG: DDE transposase, partial [Acidovorax temperans]
EGEPVLRSKQPALVRQELWGVLIAYTLLRRWMREMAAHVQVEPQRISFHTASYAIVNLLAVPSLDSAGTLPKQLAALLAQSRHFVLPPRRTGRRFPRVVKKRASKFPTKKCQSALN